MTCGLGNSGLVVSVGCMWVMYGLHMATCGYGGRVVAVWWLCKLCGLHGGCVSCAGYVVVV